MFWKTKKYYMALFSLLAITVLFTSYQHLSSQLIFHKKPSVAQLGKEYIVFATSDIIPTATKQEKVHLIEFFSYDCGTCNTIQAAIQKRYRHQSDFLSIEQIPIGDGETAKCLEKTHYLLTMLGKHAPSYIFTFLSQHHSKKIDTDAIKNWILKTSISKTDYDTAEHFTAGITAQIARSHLLQKTYCVEDIPFFVIGGRYQTDIGMAKGNISRLFEIIDQLIEKVKQGEA